ncbi:MULTISPECIES: alpha/beta fold hydrolase [Nocardiaceae]|uniref:Alpha/beta hydrolase n=1 Tax=Rhodococcoides kroppenstedtii TaxID=293050 RepID=A0ABS7NTN1_9NOCA|nr:MULTISPECIES: alpha/beta hydrolase [Rhodococcus]AMY20389.1 Putative non-heme bromoperoxidase BpoC [Rhodococcus sp. PBTS 1]MBT1191196.1 alpha/beta hydrolase [Rhodococcus kroppenstedtii]MBY6313874.1 alpha/beta hydrolase [Rhodococcus kroppenstedtii]MBY6321377.1 alpha/beta hydrolase [Rhodococcus kroppenstedtii]MBY6400076.1 alpha/beta hydrolase [Rhodococcus kroppenstedtii]
MPPVPANEVVTVNGIPLNHTVTGSGPLVVMIMGTGSPGRVWALHQVPAIVAAGYRVCTFDNRGIAPSYESLEGMQISDLVADTAGLIEHVRTDAAEKAVVVGTSMGARVAQELALARPDLVSRAVFSAGHARLDAFQQVLGEGERQLADSGVTVPPKYAAAVAAVMNLSPASLRDEAAARDWLDLFEFSVQPLTPGQRAQLTMDETFDRRRDYGRISVPCLSIGFADDRMIPAYLSREVADVIPGARYVEIADAGHYGYLEKPEEFNRAILDFLRG